LEALEGRLAPSIYFTVTNTADSGPGSLRQAILDADSIGTNTGPNIIHFDIPTTDPGYTSGIFNIEVSNELNATLGINDPLPTITFPIIIDGTSQPGYSGSPLIVLDGNWVGDVAGLTITTDSCTVKGLWIRYFQSGIDIEGAHATNNTLELNYLGNNGVSLGNNGVGVVIANGASNNTIGEPGAGNLISDNFFPFNFNGTAKTSQDGIDILGSGTTGNQVLGNYIGTTADGTSSDSNLGGGVCIGGGASNNTVGGTAPGDRNIISGNLGDGVLITDSGTTGNQVLGSLR
jgi:hypothetical protein